MLFRSPSSISRKNRPKSEKIVTAGPNLAGPLDLEQWLDEESKYEDPWWYEVCTAKIVDGEPQFTSYQTPVYPNQTEQ